MSRRNSKLFAVPDDAVTMQPFKHFAEQYWAAGWIPLPLAPREKEPPPSRATGRFPAPGWDDVKSWIKSAKEENIGIRIPDGAIGIDVDAYKWGEGEDRLAEIVADVGPLPPTWISSARADGISGIRYFRVPRGLHFPSNLGNGIDIIQFRHRYAVVPPSIHPNGEMYKWYPPNRLPDGSGAPEPPALKKMGRAS